MAIFWITRKLATTDLLQETEPGVIILDVRDLNDGPNNPYLIVPKIIMGDYIIREGNRLAVRCHGGVSRSNAVAAGIISYQLGLPFEDSIVEIVRKAVPRMLIDPAMYDSTKNATLFLKNNLGYKD